MRIINIFTLKEVFDTINTHDILGFIREIVLYKLLNVFFYWVDKVSNQIQKYCRKYNYKKTRAS